ncbi:DUF4945 domain-containing protein [Olivibacter sp. SDN3]|uniref:DUF4945 domain-containing protein n=1 Tax=Olivibacter sp. SDN3 TaxID=2764720 RepID=UPI0016514655|nr:DUF4945 domain-containing protein [Olivibacter sp. SDN3]QNL50577.1 DUF4945 domain-containing protein [Olivibacter sp. SDN3]
MKRITFIYLLAVVLAMHACIDREMIDRKEGDSLPTVNNLSVQQDGATVRLTWEIPVNIPESIEQPVSIYIDVQEILGPTRTTSVFNTTLANAPTEFVYEVPEENKTYHLTVKLFGQTKERDPNYSSSIYSLGQTVVYQSP